MLGWLVISCSQAPPVLLERVPEVESAPAPGYVVICVIHGDGSYLVHDSGGNKYRADEAALAGAMRVGELNSQAEVFIFHEKRRKKLLFLFPRDDGDFYYYRNGRLLARESYRRDQGPSRFDPEAERYHRFHAEPQPDAVRLFLYFGHEIPEMGGTGYDRSYRKRAFTVHDFADRLKGITPDSTRFDLVAISSCFNGTPYSVSALTPYARYILASPGNLHLSYFDLQPFEALDVGLRDGDVAAFAKRCAQQSFDRLCRDIQTEITVAVYDVDRVQEFVAAVDSVYDRALASWKGKSPTATARCDCADDTSYVRPAMSEGVDVLFRPARFGRSASKMEHSGWECLRHQEQARASTQVPPSLEQAGK